MKKGLIRMGRAWNTRLHRTIHESSDGELFPALDFRCAIIQENESKCYADRDYKEGRSVFT